MQEKYNVTGMTCAACSARVEKSVSALPGVQACSVNLLKNSMVVTYDDKTLSGGQIVEAVEKAGYGASPQRPAHSAAAPWGENTSSPRSPKVTPRSRDRPARRWASCGQRPSTVCNSPGNCNSLAVSAAGARLGS